MQALQVSQTIMDEYSARILLGTFDHPVSALDISRRFAIPIAACYRRIKELEGLGLVYVEAALPSRNGKGLQPYRSRLRSVRTAFEDGHLPARLEPGRDAAPAATLSAEDRSAVAEELADVVIYSLGLVDALEVDLSDAVLAKLKKDEAKYPADRFRGRAP